MKDGLDRRRNSTVAAGIGGQPPGSSARESPPPQPPVGEADEVSEDEAVVGGEDRVGSVEKLRRRLQRH